MSQTILVVDDDKKTVELIRSYLEQEGYLVETAYDGPQALALARRQQPDLIVLDWMLPHLSGLDLCRILRMESHVPIIMLTARASEEHMLQGLEYGADDYIVKPFSPRELIARMSVILRRVSASTAGQFRDEVRIGNLSLDFVAHEVFIEGRKIDLTPKEFKLLETLVRTPGRVFTRQELVERVLGPDYEGGERTIDVHMMNLRKKIEACPNEPLWLHTIYGVGYKFRRNRDAS